MWVLLGASFHSAYISIGMVHEQMFSCKFVLLESKKKNKINVFCKVAAGRRFTIVRWTRLASHYHIFLDVRVSYCAQLCLTVIGFHFLFWVIYTYVSCSLIFLITCTAALKNDMKILRTFQTGRTTACIIIL